MIPPNLEGNRAGIYSTKDQFFPRSTGRYFMVLDEPLKKLYGPHRFLAQILGLTIAESADFVRTPLHESRLTDADALWYNDLKLLLLGVSKDRMQRIDQYYHHLLLPELVVTIPDD